MKLIVALWHNGCLTPLVMKKTSTILAIGSGLFLGQAQAEIESEFHVGYNSEYVFRGVDLGSDAFEYGFDVAGSCECGFDWSAGIWSISPDGTDDDELDIYAAVSKDLGFGSVAVGFTSYQYDAFDDDAEVFLGLTAEPFAGLEAGLTAYFGVDGAMEEQIILEGSLGYSFDISSTVAVNLGLVYGYVIDDGLGVAGGYYQDEDSAYASATISVDLGLSDDITLSPYVSYVDGDDDTNIYGTKEGLIGGATLSFTF